MTELYLFRSFIMCTQLILFKIDMFLTNVLSLRFDPPLAITEHSTRLQDAVM